MFCDYPLDNDYTLEINLTNIYRCQHCFNQFKMILRGENGFWNKKNASINILVVSNNDNISFS